MIVPESIDELVLMCSTTQTPPIIGVRLPLLQSQELDRRIRDIDFFLGRIDGQPIYNHDDLVQSIASVCNSPFYFGEKWNALIDCLSDFSWYSGQYKGYVLKFIDPENLGKADLSMSM